MQNLKQYYFKADIKGVHEDFFLNIIKKIFIFEIKQRKNVNLFGYNFNFFY